jgi:Flp pilus assembly protein TadG
MKIARQHGRDRERGGVLLEATFSFPVLLLVFTGIYQFGMAFYVYNNLEQAVRSGARYASMLKMEKTGDSVPEAYVSAVQNAVVYGVPGGTEAPQVRGLTAGQVQVQVFFRDGVPLEVEVLVTNYSFDLIFTELNLANKPRIRFPYAGHYAPPEV